MSYVLEAGAGDAEADEAVVALTARPIVDANVVIVDGLVFVAIDDVGVADIGTIRNPEVLVVVGSLLEQDIAGIATQRLIVLHEHLLSRIAVGKLPFKEDIAA